MSDILKKYPLAAASAGIAENSLASFYSILLANDTQGIDFKKITERFFEVIDATVDTSSDIKEAILAGMIFTQDVDAVLAARKYVTEDCTPGARYVIEEILTFRSEGGDTPLPLRQACAAVVIAVREQQTERMLRNPTVLTKEDREYLAEINQAREAYDKQFLPELQETTPRLADLYVATVAKMDKVVDSMPSPEDKKKPKIDVPKFKTPPGFDPRWN
jgi:hypothetical protein